MRTLLSLSLLAAVACTADRPPAIDRERVLIGPVPLKRQLAWIDSALDRVVAIDASDDGTPAVHSWKIGRRPVFAAPTPAGDRVLVVTRGEEALARGQIDEDPILWSVDVTDPKSKPIAYPVSLVPENWRLLYSLNPLVGVIEGFRWALLGKQSPDFGMIAISAATILVLLVGGVFYFKRMERSFADVI